MSSTTRPSKTAARPAKGKTVTRSTKGKAAARSTESDARPSEREGREGAGRLTETSYIVLGLIAQIGPATPYDLKRMAKISTFNFWTVPHTQLYTECERLGKQGLLSEEREESGRRRRVYSLTESGREALAQWLSEPTEEFEEVRDPATLKLFFGGDPASLAAAQLAAHTRRLNDYEELFAQLPDAPEGWRLALDSGIGHEREWVRFWSRLAEDAS